ncbi:hypothetical protein BJ508DRAFT_62612 [Ascobolus immersus RN42]|uniref:RING-type domain-containing protein n=1 Tax=Ascobolus immersus RN42 TaxID=1160509 RepID=A0A3N4IN94_ASCIM|nr:hypothetical protein BJ508DRAFT_62612 [Ascobolus immersus RN42]
MNSLTPGQSPDSTSTNTTTITNDAPKVDAKGKERSLDDAFDDYDSTASQCIICLSHLPEQEPQATDLPSEEVATLVPCSHALHNACLAPWIERTNSCPMCRASFNTVRVSHYVTGPITTTYEVEDRQPPAECTDNTWMSPASSTVCPICGHQDLDRLALRCDGCLTYYHTDCVALDTVPEFAWFCYHCQNTTHNRHWARAWESMWTEQDDEQIGTTDGSGIWDRRIAIAQAQGVLGIFQETFPYIWQGGRRREAPSEEPVEETEEQKSAWQAMEQFTAAQQDDSKTTIPTPPRAESPEKQEEEQPKRRFKRPRTRPNSCFEHPEKKAKVEELPALTSSNANEASGPSIFQSLLEKVESASSPLISAVPFSLHGPPHHDTGGDSGPASPASSTGWSSHHHSTLRVAPSSPGPATSRHHSPNIGSPAYSPLYAKSPPASGSTSPGSYFTLQRSTSPQQSPRREATETPIHAPEPKHRHAAISTPSAHHPAQGLSLEIKQEVQQIVRACLKRYYQEGKVNTDQFVEINKSVSRSLYSKVPEYGIPSKNGEDSKKRWHDVVEKYVSKAVDHSKTATATTPAAAL